MPRRVRGYDYWKVATLLAALFCAGMALRAVIAQQPQTIEIQEALTMEPDYTTTWTSAGPLTQTVNTYQKEGEDITQTIARHAAKVAALLAEYPAI